MRTYVVAGCEVIWCARHAAFDAAAAWALASQLCASCTVIRPLACSTAGAAGANVRRICTEARQYVHI